MAKIKVEIDADLQDLIPQFLENRRKDITSLHELVAQKNLTAIAQLAHKIKGTSAGYGFTGLSAMAADIEKAAKNNDSVPLSKIVEDMKIYFDEIEIHFVSI